MFDKLAEELREARIKNNLTLSQLSTRTRIDLKFLEAMEEGNLGFLPDLYVKAFVKEYANVVGLDPEIMLKKYEAAKEGLPYEELSENREEIEPEPPEQENGSVKASEENSPETPAKAEEKEEDKFREVKYSAHQSNAVYSKPPPTFDSTAPKRSEFSPDNKSIIVIGASIGGAIILIGLIYFLFFNQSNEIVVTEKPYDEVVTESQQRYEETPAQAADSMQARAVSGDSLNLLIQAKDTSWIRLILDNTKEEEFILFPNSQKLIKAANDFKITFGRSSAINLQLNNKPLEFKPASKTVSHVRISSKGLEYLHNPPQVGQQQ